jgi:hypothetical protein
LHIERISPTPGTFQASAASVAGARQVRAIARHAIGAVLARGRAINMRKLIVLTLALAACVDAASPNVSKQPAGGKADGDGPSTLLDCNTPVGPDQQVTVIDNGADGLVLRELTTSGSQQDRPLSTDEWTSGTLNLRDDGFGSTSTMSKDGNDWVVRSTGGGVNEFGYADCW